MQKFFLVIKIKCNLNRDVPVLIINIGIGIGGIGTDIGISVIGRKYNTNQYNIGISISNDICNIGKTCKLFKVTCKLSIGRKTILK